jgi:hypothetical protein
MDPDSPQDIRQLMVVFKLELITDCPATPLRHLAPIAIAQLRQLDVVRVKRFLCLCSE